MPGICMLQVFSALEIHSTGVASLLCALLQLLFVQQIRVLFISSVTLGTTYTFHKSRSGQSTWISHCKQALVMWYAAVKTKLPLQRSLAKSCSNAHSNHATGVECISRAENTRIIQVIGCLASHSCTRAPVWLQSENRGIHDFSVYAQHCKVQF